MSRRLVAKQLRRSCCLKNLLHRPPDDLRNPFLYPPALAFAVDNIVDRRMRYAELLCNPALRVSFLPQETDDAISGQRAHLLEWEQYF